MNVSQLFYHPIKSAAGISVSQLNYNSLGPAHDREWMVVNSSGKFLSQRQIPPMCLLQAELNADQLTLSFAEKSTFSLDLDGVQAAAKTVQATVWSDTVTALDCGDDIADWLSHTLGKPCRLVWLSEHSQRAVDPHYAHQGQLVGFADGFPTLIASQASLDQFNADLTSQHDVAPIDMRRFRPNVVIEGCEPFAEDSWQAIRINNIEFELVKPCSRCIIPSINPDTAAKEMAINATLMKTRRKDKATYFGQNALHQGVGLIEVGAEVQLLR